LHSNSAPNPRLLTPKRDKILIFGFRFSLWGNVMPKEKRKKGFFDIFGFGEEDFFSEPQSLSKGGTGYSISVTYDEKGKPIVKVQTHGDVDVAELRRDIEQRYPSAKVEGLEKQPLIRIVDEEQAHEKKEQKKEQKVTKKEKKREKRTLNTDC